MQNFFFEISFLFFLIFFPVPQPENPKNNVVSKTPISQQQTSNKLLNQKKVSSPSSAIPKPKIAFQQVPPKKEKEKANAPPPKRTAEQQTQDNAWGLSDIAMKALRKRQKRFADMKKKHEKTTPMERFAVFKKASGIDASKKSFDMGNSLNDGDDDDEDEDEKMELQSVSSSAASTPGRK